MNLIDNIRNIVAPCSITKGGTEASVTYLYFFSKYMGLMKKNCKTFRPPKC